MLREKRCVCWFNTKIFTKSLSPLFLLPYLEEITAIEMYIIFIYIFIKSDIMDIALYIARWRGSRGGKIKFVGLPFPFRHKKRLPFLTVNYHSLPSTTIPYRQLPFPTVNYHSLPFLTIHYHSFLFFLILI